MKDSLYKNLNLEARGVWFPIIAGIIIIIFVIFMPKKLTKKEIYVTYGVVGYVALILDVWVMATVLDLFNLGNPDKVGIGDMISYAIVSPSLAVIFINFYKKDKKWLYVLVFSLISFLYEATLVRVGYMESRGWSAFYSIPIFIISYRFWFPWHLRFIEAKLEI
jgi:hypothetical protein